MKSETEAAAASARAGSSRFASLAAARATPWALAVLVGALLAAGAAALRAFGLEGVLAARDVAGGFIERQPAVALALFFVFYVIAALVSVPGVALFTTTGGFLFGPWKAVPVTLAAATCGAALLFLLARTSLGTLVARRAGPLVVRARAEIQRHAASYVLFARLVGVFPSWIVTVVCALAGVPFGTFLWATFVGIVPGTLAYSMAGAGLDSVIAAQRVAYAACQAAGRSGCSVSLTIESLMTPQLLAAFAALGVVALTPVAAQRWRARRSAP